MSYVERRAAAIAMADAYQGWARPPVPDKGRLLGRLLRSTWWVRRDGDRWEHPVTIWRVEPNTQALDAVQSAREKLQNRTKFQ